MKHFYDYHQAVLKDKSPKEIGSVASATKDIAKKAVDAVAEKVSDTATAAENLAVTGGV